MTHKNPFTIEDNSSAENTVRKSSAVRLTVVVLGTTILSLLFMIFLALQSGNWQMYVMIALASVMTALAFGAFQFTRGGRIESGGWFLLAVPLVVVPFFTLLISDLGLILGPIIVFIAYFYASQTLRYRYIRLRVFIVSIVVGILTVGTNLLNMEYRLHSPVLQAFAPFATGFVLLLVGFSIARQAWARNNIRSRFLTFSLGLTILAVAVVAGISVNSFLSAGQQAQETTAGVLRNQVQNSLEHQTIEAALKNDLILQRTSQDVQDVAQQAAYILDHPSAFNPDSFWVADEHMFFGPEGQYINGEEDISTIFVPNTVNVDDSFKQLLELSSYLDMTFVPVYEGDPNSVAIYFVSKDEMSRLYPNINLGAIVPSDYLATQDIFYTSGDPENDPDRQVVWTPVYDDPAGQGLLVSAIAPVYSGDRFMGIIGIDVSLANLTASIEEEDFSTGAYAFLIDAEGRALALTDQGYQDILGREREPGEFGVNLVASARSEFAPLLDDIRSGETGFQNLDSGDQEFFVAYAPLSTTDWYLASVASAEQVLAPASALQTQLEENSNSLLFRRILPVGVVIIVLAVVVGIYFTNRLVNPLEQLTEGAAKIGVGEWDTPLPQSGLVEIGSLSRTLREMAAQLKSTLGSLEQRVADRTKALATAAEVGRRLSAVTNPRQLTVEVVEQVQRAFNYYYAQIYLLDEAGENLVLTGGTGEAGAAMLARGHSLPKGRGLVGRAADTNESVLVPDVSQEEGWLPNDLLPETKTEAAVPISVGNQVFGVLDVQHSVVNGLTEADVTLLESLASQAAISLQNARTYEQSRRQAELETLVNVIGQKIQRTTTIEDTLQTAIRELGTAIGASRVEASLRSASAAEQTQPILPVEQAVVVETERNNGSSGHDDELTAEQQ
jgi:GAF domain-containing protein